MSATLTLTEDEVVDLCAVSGSNINFCVYPAVKPVYFIKYGGTRTMGEARTQTYVYDRTTDVPGGPRVPKIYHAFKRGWRTYMIMEYIDAPTADEFIAKYPSKRESVCNSIASGLSWLFHLPLPQDTCLGPVGGGLAVYRFFGPDHEAPLEFAHVLALQRYANEAIWRGTPCGYPDMAELSYGLCVSDPLIHDVVARVNFSRSAQLPAMYRAAALLMQCGGSSKLGLDEQGLSKTQSIWRKNAKKRGTVMVHDNVDSSPELILTTVGPWS